MVFVEIGEGSDGGVGEFEGAFFVRVEEREEGFGKTSHVPLGDAGLLSVSVAPLAINRAEGGIGMEMIHESAGTIVDGFAGESDIVGVEDAVDEANVHPASNQTGLTFDDGGKQSESGSVGGCELRVMTIEGIVCDRQESLIVLMSSGPLEGANADVAGGNAGQHGAGQGSLAADDVFAGGGNGEAACGGDAEGVHGFADEVFAKHGAEGGAAVTTA